MRTNKILFSLLFLFCMLNSVAAQKRILFLEKDTTYEEDDNLRLDITYALEQIKLEAVEKGLIAEHIDEVKSLAEIDRNRIRSSEKTIINRDLSKDEIEILKESNKSFLEKYSYLLFYDINRKRNQKYLIFTIVDYPSRDKLKTPPEVPFSIDKIGSNDFRVEIRKSLEVVFPGVIAEKEKPSSSENKQDSIQNLRNEYTQAAKESKKRRALWISGASTVVSTIGGILLYSSSRGHYDNYKSTTNPTLFRQMHPEYSDREDALNKANNLLDWSAVSTFSALVSAGFTTWFALRDTNKIKISKRKIEEIERELSSVRQEIELKLTPRGQGIGLTLTF